MAVDLPAYHELQEFYGLVVVCAAEALEELLNDLVVLALVVVELAEQVLGIHVRVPPQRFDGELEGGWFGEALGDGSGPFEAEVRLQGLELVVEVFVALLAHAVLDVPGGLGEAEGELGGEGE